MVGRHVIIKNTHSYNVKSKIKNTLLDKYIYFFTCHIKKI
jgi:hypothetical protein